VAETYNPEVSAPVLAVDAQPPLFNTLPLDPKLLRAVAESGYMSMTPIQAKAIPIVLARRRPSRSRCCRRCCATKPPA
jgi:superfamily II DNA/RNA helicase